MLLHKKNVNTHLEIQWMLDLEDLYSIIQISSLLLRITKEHASSSTLPRNAYLPS